MMFLLLLLQLVLQMMFLLLLVCLLLRKLAIPRGTLIFRTLVMMVMQVVALVQLMMLLWTHVLVLSLMLMQLVWTHVLVFLFVVLQHPLPLEPLEFYLSLEISLLFELVDRPLVSFLSWICFVPFLSGPSSRVL